MPFYRGSASTSLQSNLMSPGKLLTIADGSTTVQSNRVYELSEAKGSSDKGYGYNDLMLNESMSSQGSVGHLADTKCHAGPAWRTKE
ncbi:hypothetical protein [Sphingobacterium yanglingense]|uniref:Uncharacterized protein n=1 Tax=Sphingobacterium yanglingense TaxID=1437280 RepID=A0A4V3DE53_9SPHI|nr:hypothetical protein [Sphingobacterium yanglingense]TDQ79719.1 hypothetical protein CLV99_1167 [Sphingobacterium yanglingense]